ncbi:MAG TPA: proton-conducting transporter membrane subunit [Spirochaetia bacterium]|nr:proton-conducting transporter membrane subunit [Spirochaetia bacterium]
MMLLWLAVGLYIAGAFFASRRPLSYGVAFLASLVALAAGVAALSSPPQTASVPFFDNLRLSLSLDRLSATFILISSLSAVLLSLFAIGYGKLYGSRTAAAFSLGFAGVLIVLAAGDSLTFLSGWELVTIFSFLLMTDDVRYSGAGKLERRSPLVSASFRFLVFGEISSMLLLLAFAIVLVTQKTISFAEIRQAGPAFLVLATLGAAIKMDAVPFHIWMPGVYEQTADHSSAFLSVPLTLMGVYGLERFVTVAAPSPQWLVVLVLLGSLTAFWGALQAAAARKLKSLPAYSTVENNGMIITVIAASALAASVGTKSLSYLASFAAAAAVVLALGHALAKSLLFMSIGHAKESLGVKTIDEARGVWRGVGPVPGIGILVAGLSLSAFPPLLGYTGEWMVLETVFQSSRFTASGEKFFLAVAGFLTALAIGLAVFAMVKLVGYTALGYNHERFGSPVPDRPMKIAQLLSIILIPLLGIAAPFLLSRFGYAGLFGGLLGVPSPLLLQSGSPLFGVVSPTMFAAVIVVLAAIPLLVWRLRRPRVRRVEPWYGGLSLEEREYFTEPAFSQILLHMLRRFYGTAEGRHEGRRQLHIRDRFARPLRAVAAVTMRVGGALSRTLMNGHIYYYVAYILFAFVVVLIIRW